MSAAAAFVGGGTMAGALCRAGLAHELWQARQIAVVEPYEPARVRIAELGCRVVASCAELPDAQAVVLCVKPQDLEAACRELRAAPAWRGQPAISIAAGVATTRLRGWLDTGDLVRAMPNIPAAVAEGCTFAYAADDARGAAAQLAGRLFGACGSLHWVQDEDLIDAATALSGSGPAYGFLMLEAMTAAAAKLGLPKDIALAAAAQTLRGASAMAAKGDLPPAKLRAQVTSKGGTTAAALKVLAERGFADALAAAMRAAHARAKELADK